MSRDFVLEGEFSVEGAFLFVGDVALAGDVSLLCSPLFGWYPKATASTTTAVSLVSPHDGRSSSIPLSQCAKHQQHAHTIANALARLLASHGSVASRDVDLAATRNSKNAARRVG